MDLSFLSADLRKLCEVSSVAQRRLGRDSAKRLRTRLAELLAAAAVSELVAGDPHPLVNDRAGQYSLKLAGGHRLVFAPDHEPVPMLDVGGIDWRRVTKVQIVFIGDYHD
jgi:proteic killer suppression protein